MSSNVQVCCRFRPANKNELAAGASIVAQTTDRSVKILVENTSLLEDLGLAPTPTPQPPTNAADANNDAFNKAAASRQYPSFNFDAVFDWDSEQQSVFERTAKPLVKDVFAGYNTTLFAYGQTGSGKTWTMMGQPQSDQYAGIIPRLVSALFDGIEDADESLEFTVKLSYIEVYMERVRCLLSPPSSRCDSLKIREGQTGLYVEGATETYVGSYDQVLQILEKGSANRAQASTLMNAESSRSHSVFILTLGQQDKNTGSKKNSKLTLVDLAGSEKIAKTGATGEVLEQAKMINKSLSALGNVINALTSHTAGKHIPYRDSKLTRLLSDSLGGNSKTLLIVTASPMSVQLDETISSLRFGIRAKLIQNKAKINVEKSVAEYKRLLSLARQKCRLQESIILALEQDLYRCTVALQGTALQYLPGGVMPLLTSNEVVAALNSQLQALSLADDDSQQQQQQQQQQIQQSAAALPAITQQSAITASQPVASMPATPLDHSVSQPQLMTDSLATTITQTLSEHNAQLQQQQQQQQQLQQSSAHMQLHSSTTTAAAPGQLLTPAQAVHGGHRVSSASLDALPQKLTQLTIANTELEQRVHDLEEQRERIQETLIEFEEANEIWSVEKEVLTLENDNHTKELDETRRALHAAEQKSTELQSQIGELSILRKKFELLEKDHACARNDWKEEKVALQAKLSEALNEMNENNAALQQQQSTASPSLNAMLSPPLKSSHPSSAPPSAQPVTPHTREGITTPVPFGGFFSSGTRTPKGEPPNAASDLKANYFSQSSAAIRTAIGFGMTSGGIGLMNNKKSNLNSSAQQNFYLPNMSHLDDSAKLESLTQALTRKCDAYVQLQMAHVNANEHISMLEVLLAESNARLKDQASKPNKRISELEEQLQAKDQQIQKLMDGRGRRERDDRDEALGLEMMTIQQQQQQHSPNGSSQSAQNQVVLRGGGAAKAQPQPDDDDATF